MLRLKKMMVVAVFSIVCFYIVLFCLRNDAAISVDFFFVQVSAVPLDLVVLASFICGGLLGLISALGMLMSMRKKYRKALSQVKLSH